MLKNIINTKEEEEKGAYFVDLNLKDDDGFKTLDPSLDNATFEGTKWFTVEDYIHGGTNQELKKEMFELGRAW